MTPEIVKAIDDIFDAKVPIEWMKDVTGAEISWLYSSMGSWNTSLALRNN